MVAGGDTGCTAYIGELLLLLQIYSSMYDEHVFLVHTGSGSQNVKFIAGTGRPVPHPRVPVIIVCLGLNFSKPILKFFMNQ